MTAEPLPDVRDNSKAERVYADLRRRIRELTLPPGAPLRKEEIAANLGVSRAPVSEAIARLAEEGLVDVFPQHGSFVALIRAADVRESLLIRTALETEAMRRAASLSETPMLEALDANIREQERALKAGDFARFYDLDEGLHAAIFGALEMPRAVRLLDAARAPLDRVRRLALPEGGRAGETLAEHKRIVDALRSGDAEFAAAAMRAHLAAVGRSIERSLADLDKSGE